MANVDPIPGQEGVPTNQDKRISNQGDEVAPIAVEGQDNGVDTGSARNSLDLANDERTRKRDRDSEYGPTTPRGEIEEHKPLDHGAKKSRMQPLSSPAPTDDSLSARDRPESPEGSEKPEQEEKTPSARPEQQPSPSTPSSLRDSKELETVSAPGTPALANKAETSRVKQIREKVQELEVEVDEDGRRIEIDKGDELTAEEDVKDATDAKMDHGEEAVTGSLAHKATTSEVMDVSPVKSSAPPPTARPKSTQPTFASFAGAASPFASVPTSSSPSFGSGGRVPSSPFRAVNSTSGSIFGNKTNSSSNFPSTSSTSSSSINLSKPTVPSITTFTATHAAKTPIRPPGGTAGLKSPSVSDQPLPDTFSPLPPSEAQLSGGTATSSGTMPPPPTPIVGATALPATSTTKSMPAAKVTSEPTPSKSNAFSAFASSKSPFASVSSASASSSSFAPSTPSSSSGGFGPGAGAGMGFGAFANVKSPFATAQNGSGISGKGKEVEKHGEEDAEKDEWKEGSQERGEVSKQDVITGEESEETLHTVQAKLYYLEGGQWKERGKGRVKVNEDLESEGIPKIRIVMRSEAVHRLILNLSIFPGMKSEVSDAKFVRFSGTELGDGGKPQVRAFMIRLSNTEQAKQLQGVIADSIERLKAATGAGSSV